MLSKKDKAIKENIQKQHTIATFYRNVYIRKPDDAIIADSIEDFLKQITDPCHIWQGSLAFNGYGYFSVYSVELKQRIMVKAHRFAYALAYGIDALPDGVNGGDGQQLILNHTCYNRACVNVKHLEVITHAENISIDKRKPIDV